MDISFENYSLRTFVGSLVLSFISMHWQLWYRRAEHKNNAKVYDNIYLMALEGIIERNDRFTQCVRCTLLFVQVVCSFVYRSTQYCIDDEMIWIKSEQHNYYIHRACKTWQAFEWAKIEREKVKWIIKKSGNKKKKNKAGNMNRVHIGKSITLWPGQRWDNQNDSNTPIESSTINKS